MNQEKSGTYRVYFFDTYALIELFQGSKAYEMYKGARVVTNIFNLYELYYNLRKELPESTIRPFFDKVAGLCVEVYPEFLIEAAEFRPEFKKDLSYADCLGYVMAMRFGIKFLTGDKEFKDLPNVEFVK